MQRRRFVRSLASVGLGALLPIVGSGAAGALSACVGEEDGNTTTGKRVTLATRAELAGALQFSNAFGWRFSLTKVLLSVGPLYYFDGEPLEPVAQRAPQLPRFSLISVAHAHPGHYKEGNAKGEMLTASSFDLATGPVLLAAGDGTSGLFRSARLTFQTPAEGALAADLGAAVVIVEGSASKDAATTMFRLVGLVDDVLDAEGLPKLDGCTFDETDVEGDGTVTLSIDPAVWLDQAQLDNLPPATTPVEVARDHAVHVAFARGLKKAIAYRFRFAADG